MYFHLCSVSGSGSGSARKQKSLFVYDVDFCSRVPAVPFVPKLFSIPLSTQRLTRYCGAQLETENAMKLNLENTLGITMDCIQLDQYAKTKQRKQIQTNNNKNETKSK
jgi:hypothetical protein